MQDGSAALNPEEFHDLSVVREWGGQVETTHRSTSVPEEGGWMDGWMGLPHFDARVYDVDSEQFPALRDEPHPA